jgi:uncharacterized membrane protein
LSPGILERYVETIREKAFFNEAGCYFPHGIRPGTYRVVYVFKLYPPTHVDDKYAHLNLKLAEKHIPYKSFSVEIRDIDMVKLYVHVPEYKVLVKEGSVLVTGSSPANTLIEIEFVAPKNRLLDLSEYPLIIVNDVVSKASRANSFYYIKYSLVKGTSYLLAVLVLAYPLMLVALYYRVGKEEEYTVPEYLSYVPNPSRKPWQVNLVFHKDVMDMDENAFYATILDLVRRGILSIREAGDDDVVLEINEEAIKRDEKLDGYESTTLEFLRRFGEGNMFSFKRFRERVEADVKRNRSAAQSYTDWFKALRTPPREALDLVKQLIEPRKPIPIWVIVASFFAVFALIVLLANKPAYYIYPQRIAIYGFTLIGEMVLSYKMPSYVFGRWKRDYYKEKLEWEAFRKFLSDLAQLKKYAPQDIVIWKEWLVYATALGVADKVVEAMKELNIPIPREAMVPIVGRPIMRSAVSTAFGATGRGGAGGGGGFGAGGGFGGGGGGVR